MTDPNPVPEDINSPNHAEQSEKPPVPAGKQPGMPLLNSIVAFRSADEVAAVPPPTTTAEPTKPEEKEATKGTQS